MQKSAEAPTMVEDSKSKNKKEKLKKIDSTKKTKLTSFSDPDHAASVTDDSITIPKNGKGKNQKNHKRKKPPFPSSSSSDSEESETSSEMGEPIMINGKNNNNNNNNKNKKMRFQDDGEVEKEEDPNSVSNFRISKPLREMLKVKGIESLFPIQAMTFNTILDGSDLVGRARTGQVSVFFSLVFMMW